jgi:hypothetical protein
MLDVLSRRAVTSRNKSNQALGLKLCAEGFGDLGGATNPIGGNVNKVDHACTRRGGEVENDGSSDSSVSGFDSMQCQIAMEEAEKSDRRKHRLPRPLS